MRLALGRVIIFTPNLEAMRRFYEDVIGLLPGGEEDGWIEFDAGSCGIALHQWDGEAPEGPVKIVFHSDDVRGDRARLVSLGVEMGEVVTFGAADLCDGFDPDGNAFQLSSRPVVGRVAVQATAASGSSAPSSASGSRST